MKWIEEKMKLLGCDRHPSYKLAFYLDSRAMITIHSEKYGVIEVGIILSKASELLVWVCLGEANPVL